MQNIKLFISLAFRSEGTKQYYNDAIYDFNAIHMRKYIQALGKEIISSAQGMEDSQVSEIEFGIGAFNNQLVSDMEDLYELINKNFRLSRNVKVVLHATPGGMDFYKFTVGRHFHDAEIILEFPSLNNEDLINKGYKSNKDQIIEILKLSHDLQYPSLSVEIDNGEYLNETLELLSQYKLLSVYFKNKLNENQLNKVQNVLKPVGYKYLDNYFSRSASSLTETEQLGSGINAINRFSDISYKNTDDLDLYLQYSDDFEKIAHKI